MARTDEEVMLRLKGGEEEALGVLLERYRRPVMHHLFRMVHESAAAEELAQDVFVRVYRARKTYTPRAKFTTWLFRIATNVGLNALRDGRQRREKEVSADTETGEALARRVPGNEPTPEAHLLTGERNRRIREAVNCLPENQRMAVLLHKYQGLDYAEIGEVLGVSQSALKSLLFRAYERLRSELRPVVEEREAS